MHPYPRRAQLRSLETEIFKLVSYGATPEQWAQWLRVPLEHAAARGNLEIVTKLLDAGADSTAGWRGCRGRTLLDAAALGGDADTMSTLLRTGAREDLNVVSVSSRRSALYLAVECGHDATALRLIQAGAGVNFRDPADKYCPLLKAVLDGHEQLVRGLLTAGAYPNTRDGKEEGYAPLHVAASQGNTRILSVLLVNGADQEALDNRGASPLHHAIVRGHLVATQILLAAGADVEKGGSFPALVVAAIKGYPPILEAIIKHGANVKFRDNVGRTALHAANSAGAIHALVDAGAEVNAQRFDGGTPLHFAACTGSRGPMLALLRRGADVDARHMLTMQTPLHVACQYQRRGLDMAVDLLLRWGATETAVGGDGRTATELLEISSVIGRECSDEEIQLARLLLSRAEEDRRWRRRCWLVMLRWRAEKGGTATGADVNVFQGDACGALAYDPQVGCATMARVEQGSEGHLTLGSESRPRAERAGARRLSSMVAKLVGLESEGVFRAAVEFL